MNSLLTRSISTLVFFALIFSASSALLALVFASSSAAQNLSREQWGAPAVMVTHAGRGWVIAGRKNRVTLDESNLSIKVQAGDAAWEMVPSSAKDMLVRSGGEEFYVRLAGARKVSVTPYDTGFKTGVKVVLGGWRRASEKQSGEPARQSSDELRKDGGELKQGGSELDLSLVLTVCLEGRDEELVFDTVAEEGEAVVRHLDWPTATDARAVDYTVLSNGRGTLLPRDWPKEYFPIRTITPEGKIAASDHSVLQSHVVESWSMSWWGFLKGSEGLMFIVETPDDAAYQFSHPAGGPTRCGPRWLASLGRLGYPRTVRVSFIHGGSYVAMAKRYRRYVMDTGLFVSLKEKIARTPGVRDLIGTPQTRVGGFRQIKQESDRYDAKDPSKNRTLATFDERARQLRGMKARGFDRLFVFISGWPHEGYDHQHPDPLPPSPEVGGWDALKRLADTCRELGYPFILHDQYRDYYTDAPSYDPQFAIREEDASLPAKAFAGSRFGDWKEGQIPFMRHWDGGKQTYLNARFQLGHLVKNYRLFFDHQIRPQGIYIDVIGYVPPDEDFNPEHPTTRADAMRGQAAMLNWARANLGVTATEAGSDWVVPYVDTVNQSGGGSKAILVPLYQLVYHDAVVISYGARDQRSLLQGLLFGGVPEIPAGPQLPDEKTLALMRQMAALHARVGLLEMTRHEFLDNNFRKERTTFADGTTVTVDWDANTYTVSPELANAK